MTKHEQVELMQDIIKDIKFTMLTTMSIDGKHRSCPMTTIEVKNFDDGIWFIGANGTDTVADIHMNKNVCLSYAAPNGNDYVSITGEAALVENPAKLDELWSEMYQVFFDGKDDPKIQLIHVKPIEGEYWKGDNSIVSFIKMGTAALTGEKVESLGENGKVLF